MLGMDSLSWRAVSRAAQSSELAGDSAAMVSVILALLCRDLQILPAVYFLILEIFLMNKLHLLLESLGGIDFSSLGVGALQVSAHF